MRDIQMVLEHWGAWVAKVSRRCYLVVDCCGIQRTDSVKG